MKTTLTKADPAGWYKCDGDGREWSFWWDGVALRNRPNGMPRAITEFSNFRLLVEAPAEYFTAKKRAEQFFTDFAAHPVRDMQAIFERHLNTHVVSLVETNKLLAARLNDAKDEARDSQDETRNQKAAALFHKTQMEETMNVARGHGWQPGSSLANWLKEKLKSPVPVVTDVRIEGDKLQIKTTDIYVGTQDTSDVQGIGDGDDTWEAPELDDRYEPSPETLVSKVEILDAKCVPDSPGEWHHRNGHILRVWESKHPQKVTPELKGQLVTSNRATGLKGGEIEMFREFTPVWMKAVPPTDPCEAVKTLRQLARDVHEACDKAGIPTHHPKMARAALAQPLSIRDRLQRIVTRCHDAADAIKRLNADIDERDGKLYAIGRLVLPFAGETLVNAVVRKFDLLNRLIEAIQPEGDPVGTVRALRAQRDQLRTEAADSDSTIKQLRGVIESKDSKIHACRKELQHVRAVANELQGVIDRNIKAAA